MIINLAQTLLNRFVNFSRLILASLVFVAAALAAGEVDPTFNVAVQETIAGSVQTIVVQSDGKLLVGGNFNLAGNLARSGVARLNADGTVDPTFAAPDFFKATLYGTYSLKEAVIYAIAVQADGKILVGGDFNKIGTSVKRGIVRLNADGSLDNSFGVSYYENGTDPQIIYDIKIQSDNKILIGGDFILREVLPTTVLTQWDLARLKINGSIDTSFIPPPNTSSTNSLVRSFIIQPDGKIIYTVTAQTGSFGSVNRVNNDGTPDNSFVPVLIQSGNTSNGVAVNRIVLQTDGKILVGGLFTTVNSFPQNNLTRLNADGSLDASFNPNGAGPGQRINAIAVLPDGKIAIGGQFDTYNNVQRRRNARLNANGTLDMTFNYNPGNAAIINDIRALSDGKVILGGSDPGGTWDKLTRLNADGSLDATFAGAIYQKGVVFKVLTQPDGKILIGGAFRKVNGIVRTHLARLNQDGSVDPGFIANADNGGITSIALQADGKILVTGAFTGFNGIFKPGIARLNTDGSLDTSFTASRTGYRIAVQPDGKILVAGSLNFFGSSAVARLNTNGLTDNTFNQPNAAWSGFVYGIRALEVLPDGKIFIGGEFIQINGVPRGRIAKLNADGTLDTSFNPPFGANGSINDLTVQSNGKIVIGGEFLAVNGSTVGTHPYIARFLPDGTLDSSFNAAANNYVHVLERQSDDKILVGGLFSQINGVSRFGIARLNQDGANDNSFSGTGTNDVVHSIFIQPDDKILIGGEFSRVNGFSSVGVARLLNAPSTFRTPYDFDGDGKADLSVFRPSNGVWYQLNSTTNQQTGRQFGAAGDVITPADFDGDGKTDLAVYRNGSWYIQQSQLGFIGVAFGAPGDLPVPADYDADGKADIAVWRPSNGTWYRLNSSNGQFVAIQFGQLGDKPTLGDFDGNGAADIAVFRPSNGVWYRINAENQQIGTQFGANGDLVVPADYDGDGKTDLAVWRPSNGIWYLMRSSLGFAGIQFGAATDKPSPADYDGDGRADITVYRPTNGYWYQLKSTQGYTETAFGIAEDLPNPNAFVR